jgi:NAD-dependent dihydropyrimidine dehydrogenase PreA subunit
MAPFMIAGRSLRNRFGWTSLRLTATADTCTACGNCTKKCPMSLPVQTMVSWESMEDEECILCGSCVDVCKSSSIHFSFSPGGTSAAQKCKQATVSDQKEVKIHSAFRVLSSGF